MFFPQQCWRRTHGRCRTAVGLSITGAEGARLVRVWVSARVMIGTVADARGGGSNERGGRGRDSTAVTRPRLLVTLFRVVVVVLSMFCWPWRWCCPLEYRGGFLFSVFFWLFEREGLPSRRYRVMRACQRRYASPSSPGCSRSGFKQPLALMKGCLHCLSERVSSWQFRQWPQFSRRAAAWAVVVGRPLHRGGSSV